MDFVTFTQSPLYRALQEAHRRVWQAGAEGLPDSRRRLAWLIGFAATRLAGADADELRRWDLEVKAFVGTWGDQHQLAEVPLSRDDLTAMQVELRGGLGGIFAFPPCAWPTPYDVTTAIGPAAPPPWHAKKGEPAKPPKDAMHDGRVFRPWQRWERRWKLSQPSLPALFHLQAGDEVVAALKDERRPLIRRCASCETFFVPVRGQRYCSLEHTYAAMAARKAKRASTRRRRSTRKEQT